jgi:hypothetical protein
MATIRKPRMSKPSMGMPNMSMRANPGSMGAGQGLKKGGKVPKTTAEKKFAALAPPKNRITFADKIAGAKKRVKKAKTGMLVPKRKSVSKNVGNLNKAKRGGKISKKK